MIDTWQQTTEAFCPEVYIDISVIVRLPENKSLGIVFENQLNWDAHIT